MRMSQYEEGKHINIVNENYKDNVIKIILKIILFTNKFL
jgi:hypothetical protein